MARTRDAAKQERPQDTGTFSSGGVPVRRHPSALARRFFQICTTVTAETVATENLPPLTLAVLAYLNKVNGEPDIDQNSLAARLGIDRASTSQLVDELATKGLVDRRVNGADRRSRLLRLTPNGERLRTRLQPAQHASQMRVFASLSPKERELLFDLLVRVIESNSALARPGTGRRKPAARKPSLRASEEKRHA